MYIQVFIHLFFVFLQRWRGIVDSEKSPEFWVSWRDVTWL